MKAKKMVPMNGSFTTKVADCLIDHLIGTNVADVQHFLTKSTMRLIDKDGSIYILTLTKED